MSSTAVSAPRSVGYRQTLKDQTIRATGATGAIGQAVCVMITDDDATGAHATGARVRAAGCKPHAFVSDIRTPEEWRLTFAIALDAMFRLCQAALPQMVAQGAGAIGNRASQRGAHPAPNHIADHIAKATVASFAQALARNDAPQKWRASAGCLG
jgi:2-hydroxycyclohexanecarboxyl-CoA dehydrogenase